MLKDLKISMSYANTYKNYGIYVKLAAKKAANTWLNSNHVEFDI